RSGAGASGRRHHRRRARLSANRRERRFHRRLPSRSRRQCAGAAKRALRRRRCAEAAARDLGAAWRRAVSANAVPRLALWRTIAASFAFTFGDRSRFTRLAWPWLAVSVIVGFVTLGTASGGAAMALRVALYVAAFVGFGLAWCRAILSDEDRAWYAPPRLELRALRFLCYALLIAMAMVLPFCALFSLFAWKIVPIMAQWGLQQTLGAALGVLALVLAIGWAFIARLLPALAAIAADVEGDVLAQAWMLGRGQWPRLIAGPLLCAAPFELLQIIFDAIPNAGSFAI